MGTRQWILFVLFLIHWVAFAVVLIRRRRLSVLLPLGVFTLLMLAQVFWNSPDSVPVPGVGEVGLGGLFRVGAWVLAVPSLGLMGVRIAERRRARRRNAESL